MLAPRLALAGAAVAAVVLSGCAMPPEEEDRGVGQGARTVTPPTVLRTPVVIPTAPQAQSPTTPTTATTPTPGPEGVPATTPQ